MNRMKKIIIREEKEYTKFGTFDCVVLGGGPAGICAALSASRNGLNTILIERLSFLGGLATGGLVIKIYGGSYEGKPVVRGLFETIIEKLRKKGFADEDKFPNISPEGLKLILDGMAKEANIDILFETFASGVVIDEKKKNIKFLLVENKEGSLAIEGKSYIDASGDGDFLKWCNLSHTIGDNGRLKPVTCIYRFGNVKVSEALGFLNSPEYQTKLGEWKKKDISPQWNPTIHPGEVWTDELFFYNINPLNSEELTQVLLKGREEAFKMLDFYKKNFPGFEKAYLIDTAPLLGIRETRLLQGLYRLTLADIKNKKQFKNSVFQGIGPNGLFKLPYECLVPSRIENLIFAGRCISVEHNAIDYVREIAPCMAVGEVAGTSASLSVSTEASFEKIDIIKLQNLLKKDGFLI